MTVVTAIAPGRGSTVTTATCYVLEGFEDRAPSRRQDEH